MFQATSQPLHIYTIWMYVYCCPYYYYGMFTIFHHSNCLIGLIYSSRSFKVTNIGNFKSRTYECYIWQVLLHYNTPDIVYGITFVLTLLVCIRAKEEIKKERKVEEVVYDLCVEKLNDCFYYRRYDRLKLVKYSLHTSEM